MRQHFEKWALKNLPSSLWRNPQDDERYYYSDVNGAWDAWKEATKRATRAAKRGRKK